VTEFFKGICSTRAKHLKGAGSMFKNYPDVVNVEQFQKMLGIGKNTAYILLKNNTVKSIRIGRVHRIPKANIIKYLKSTQ
jgi:excisionase family DNA binding protein